MDSMDTEEKKRILASYVALRLDVEIMEDRLARLRSEETLPPMREGDGSQHTRGTGDRLERATIRRMEYEEANGPKIRAGRRTMRAIEDAIDDLHDPLERTVLRLRYLDSDNARLVKWGPVAARLFGDDDERYIKAVHRLHNGALEKIYLEDIDI